MADRDRCVAVGIVDMLRRDECCPRNLTDGREDMNVPDARRTDSPGEVVRSQGASTSAGRMDIGKGRSVSNKSSPDTCATSMKRPFSKCHAVRVGGSGSMHQ